MVGSIPAVFAITKLFSDVSSTDWYSQAAQNLAEKGIIKGYADGTFGAKNNVNRAELVVALDRLLHYMETKTSNVAGIEWDVIKKYVTSTYPISANYFDAHFKFISSTPGQSIPGDYDYVNKNFSTLLSDVIRVNYVFSLEDADGKTQNFTNFSRIYLQNGKVIESKDMPSGLSAYEKSNFLSVSYDEIAPTKELKIALSKNDAIKLAQSKQECIDPKYFPDNTAANNLALEFAGGEVYWNWQNNLSYCRINAENGAISVNLQLPQ